MESAGWLAKVIDDEKPARVFIDVGGVGAGVCDRLKEMGKNITAINFGSAPFEPAPLDEHGKPYGGPANRRAEMWSKSRDWLDDPAGVSIPDSDSLQADACGPGYKYDSNTRLLLESKDDMRRRGMIPGSRTLSMTKILAGARLGRSLNVSPSEEIVVVKRLRLADGESMAIETLHIPEALVPGLTPKSLTGSFYDLLRDRYGVQIVEGIQAIEPTVTNEEESEVLGVPLHSPAFLFERTSRDDAGRTVEFVQSVYRGDRYRIVTELSRRDV